MFTRDGISALHGWTHESLDVLLRHVSSVPDGVLHNPIAGFGVPTIWKQLVHILEVEEAWVCDLQDKPWIHWREREPDCATMQDLLHAKERVRRVTQTYLHSLTDTQLNTTLTHRPKEWVGPLKSPAFIVHHIVTHTFPPQRSGGRHASHARLSRARYRPTAVGTATSLTKPPARRDRVVR